MSWPSSSPERDQFVLQRRAPHDAPDPWAAPDIRIENEEAQDGTIASTLTVFLVGRECPWRCVMCDLWRQTTAADTPGGAIPSQISRACGILDGRRRTATHIKLYNAGSFFDPHAVPESDYRDIASHLQRFRRVIVECHPSLVGHRIDRFLEQLRSESPGTALEVAMGLETAHPAALEGLNKHMDVRRFAQAAEYLRARRIALRVFVLISPPFVPAAEQDEWLGRSLDLALACGASMISLIPTRGGNGAMEALAAAEFFTAPSAAAIARSMDLARRHVGNRAMLQLDSWSAP